MRARRSALSIVDVRFHDRHALALPIDIDRGDVIRAVRELRVVHRDCDAVGRPAQIRVHLNADDGLEDFAERERHRVAGFNVSANDD